MRAIALGELPEGSMRACVVSGREVLICRSKDGVHALDAICTHADARMDEGRLRGTRLICPMHGGAFDVRDGRVLSAPATEPLQCHRVRIVDGQVEVAIDPDAKSPRAAD